ncbi:MAG: hypothetical protein Q8R55_00085, partial [Candidatus Taylorbacteria bacterium]|nr:hypothetical protein [Candidatus Taylorbacteria bacterium]
CGRESKYLCAVNNMKFKHFSKKELRWDFYPRMMNLMKHGFDIEAYIMMLSIWNFARFRYAVRSFNLDKFCNTIQKLEPVFKKFLDQTFKSIDLDKYGSDLKKIFSSLASIKGIEKTGAPKIMHLRIPGVFVMWDTWIRNFYGFKNGDAEDYLNFLKLMQEKFGNMKKTVSDRTLAKLIDEHNYITITLPGLKKKKK